jgi:hypothetical protein
MHSMDMTPDALAFDGPHEVKTHDDKITAPHDVKNNYLYFLLR